MDYKYVNDYELIYMIRENDEDTNDFLFSKYLSVIKKISSKYFLYAKDRGVEFDDLIQEGYIGLASAINSFKDNMDSTFYTFACLCIERQIRTFCKKTGSNKQEVLNQALSRDYDNLVQIYSPYNISFDKEIISMESFLFYKNLFSLKHSTVFELRYNGFSYQEISELLDIPINTVDSRLCKIRKILKQTQKN